MFRETKAFSGFAVPDIAAAKAFYGDTLGIDVTWGSPRGAGEDHGMLTIVLPGGDVCAGQRHCFRPSVSDCPDACRTVRSHLGPMNLVRQPADNVPARRR